MTRILAHLGPEPQEASRAQAPSPTLEKVKAVLYALLDCLKAVGYALKSLFYYLTSAASASKSVFKGEICTKTGNFPKFTEISRYVSGQRRPERLPTEASTIASMHGFTNIETHVRPQFSSGLCQGGSTLFCKRWVEHAGDAPPDFSDFRSGVPLEGAFYQEAYETLFLDTYKPDLAEAIRRGDEHAPKGYENAQPIFDARAAKPNGTAKQIQKWTLENRSKRIAGCYLATLRDATDYEDTDLDRTKANFELAGLSAEVLHYRKGPQEVLERTSTLAPGVYNLSFPVYDMFGNHQKGLHTVAFAIQEGRPAYFYDANLCIASASRTDVQATIGRLFTHYTGLDYSTDFNGVKPCFGRRALNFIQERANPPPGPVEQRFELIRITAAIPARPTDASV